MQPVTELAATADAAIVQARGAQAPRVAIVAGSGLGALAAAVESPVVIDFDDLPGIPRLTDVPGHAGELTCGRIGDVPVCVFGGRVHLYQGATALEAAFPARLAAALGADTLVLTNAAGSVTPELSVGDLVLIADHINLTGHNPLVGWPGPPGGNPFVPMRDAWTPELREAAMQVAVDLGIALHDGVYAGLLGPSYETLAEVAMLRGLGADLVGMSTVMEAIAARALGLRLLGLSLVTNEAAGTGLSHAEVLEVGRAAGSAATELLVGILQRL